MTLDQILTLALVWTVVLICILGFKQDAHRKKSPPPQGSNARLRRVLGHERVYRDDETLALYCPLDPESWESDIEWDRRTR